MTKENEGLLGAVINTLDNISVPNVYTEQISIPVYNCARVLRQILESEGKAVQALKPETEEPPKEEIVNDTADSAE